MPTGQVVKDKDLEEERQRWVEWLEDEGVPDEDKRKELCSRDGKGWTVLHHAARHGSTKVLSCAADIDGGQALTNSVECNCNGATLRSLYNYSSLRAALGGAWT